MCVSKQKKVNTLKFGLLLCKQLKPPYNKVCKDINKSRSLASLFVQKSTIKNTLTNWFVSMKTKVKQK